MRVGKRACVCERESRISASHANTQTSLPHRNTYIHAVLLKNRCQFLPKKKKTERMNERDSQKINYGAISYY